MRLKNLTILTNDGQEIQLERVYDISASIPVDIQVTTVCGINNTAFRLRSFLAASKARMDLHDMVFAKIAPLVYGTTSKGRPICTNSEARDLTDLVSQLDW